MNKQVIKPQTTVLTKRMNVSSKKFKKFQKILLEIIKERSKKMPE